MELVLVGRKERHPIKRQQVELEFYPASGEDLLGE